MGTSKTRLTKEEFLTVIENYRRNGRDTAELEEAFREEFPDGPETEASTLGERIADLRSRSPVTEGACCLCGTEGSLHGGVCEKCFVPWATRVAENEAGARKNKRGEKPISPLLPGG